MRGRRAAMIFQDPMMTLNPVLRVDTQMIEAITAHERVSQAAARARARDALVRGRDRVAGGAAQRLSAPVLRRHAPARRDRDRAAAPARAADRRRADHRARRHHPVADPRRGAGARRRDRHGADLDHARPRGDRRPRRPHRRDVCGPHRRAGSGRRGARRAAASLYARPDRLGAEPRASAARRSTQIPGMAPSLAHLPPGCAFAPRCARADAVCDAMPELAELAPAHAARCWHPYLQAGAAA